MFISMVQIAVYAGAIMVLFLFVIMLLGVEDTTDTSGHLRWLSLAVLVLSFVLVAVFGLALLGSQFKLSEPQKAVPLVRAVHAATDIGAVDLVVDGETVASGVVFHQAGPIAPLPEVAPAPADAMENPRGFGQEPAQGARQGARPRGLEQQMDVVGHHGVGIERELVVPDHPSELAQNRREVLGGGEIELPVVAAGHHVHRGLGGVEPGGTRHGHAAHRPAPLYLLGVRLARPRPLLPLPPLR